MINASKPLLTKGERARESIKLAILRIEKGRPKIIGKNRKLSISSAAEEAGLSPASIHNSYPDMAELIRQKIGVDMRKQKNTLVTKLNDSKSKNKVSRDEISELKREIALLVSLNATLMLKNSELLAIVSSENVKIFPSK